MDLSYTVKALEKKGYKVSVFDTGDDAVRYLCDTVRGKTVGFGGSQTLVGLGLREALAKENAVYAADFPPEGETRASTMAKSLTAEVFFLSANAVSRDGEIVNIDGRCNRIAGSLFGHEKVVFVIGENKIGGTRDEAIARARNIAAPKNALRLHKKTPCAEAVREGLEKKCREAYGITGEIPQAAWAKFLEETPIEEIGTKCYDCQSDDRICGGLLVHMIASHAMETEVVILKEERGY